MTGLVALEHPPTGGVPSVALTCLAMPVESSYRVVSWTPFPRVCAVTAPRGDIAGNVGGDDNRAEERIIGVAARVAIHPADVGEQPGRAIVSPGRGRGLGGGIRIPFDLPADEVVNEDAYVSVRVGLGS